MTFDALHLLSDQRSFPKFLGFHHFLNLAFLQDQTTYFASAVCGLTFLYTFGLLGYVYIGITLSLPILYHRDMGSARWDTV